MVSKIPSSQIIFTGLKVAFYQDNNVVKNDVSFQLLEISSEKVCSILKDSNPFKESHIGNLSGKFFIDATNFSAEPISQFNNSFIKFNSFPISCKILKFQPLSKKGSKINPQNCHCISLLTTFQILLKEFFIPNKGFLEQQGNSLQIWIMYLKY